MATRMNGANTFSLSSQNLKNVELLLMRYGEESLKATTSQIFDFC